MSSIGASRFTWSTVPSSGGRARSSRSVSEAVPLSSEVIASPIGSRSCRQAGTSFFEFVDRVGELVAVVGERLNDVLRLSISFSITWLLSANAFENDDVLENSDSSVPPWPCSTCSSDAGVR